MLSSLQALNTAGASASRTFRPKLKPRARRGGRVLENETAAEDNSEPVQHLASVAGGSAAPPDAASQAVPNFTKRLDLSTTPLRHSIAPPPLTPLPAGHSAAPFSSSPTTTSTKSSETGESSKGKKRRVSSSSAPRKRRVESVDEAIDPARMTMKDIIKLVEAKERKKQKGNAAKKRETQSSAGSSIERERELVVPLAPQVEIVDDEIVIKQQSLEIDARVFNKDDVGTYRRIEESSSKLNYQSYLPPIRRDKWKPQETELFYKAVQQFGTDFAVIQRLFPEKIRKQIKNKYKKEQRNNPRLLSELILQPREDLSYYEDLVNRLRASAEAAKAEEDEFAFTWDINTNRTNEEEDAAENGNAVETGTFEENR